MGTLATSLKRQQRRLQTPSNRFALLLFSQFALIAIYPLAGTTGRRPSAWFSVFAMTLFLTALNLVIEKRHLRSVALILCAAAIVCGLLNSLGFERVFLIPSIICSMIFMVFTTAVILKIVISSTKVTHETLYGAVAAYLFIGITCGMAYALIERLVPGSLRMTVNTGQPLAWPDFMFFSFITLTSVGYGDLIPVGGIKALVMLEAVTGAMYPPLLIGRLLTLLPGREGC